MRRRRPAPMAASRAAGARWSSKRSRPRAPLQTAKVAAIAMLPGPEFGARRRVRLAWPCSLAQHSPPCDGEILDWLYDQAVDHDVEAADHNHARDDAVDLAKGTRAED